MSSLLHPRLLFNCIGGSLFLLFGYVTQAYGDVLIDDVPFLSQLSASCSPNYLCGYASTTMLTAFYHDTTPQTSVMQDMAEHIKGSRCPTTLSNSYDYQNAAREIGNTPDAYRDWLTWDELKAHLNNGLPVAVTLKYGTLGSYRCDTSWNAGHSVVVVGYSASQSEWTIHDPLCSTINSGAYKSIPSATFRQAVYDATNSDMIDGLLIPHNPTKCIAGYGATANSPSTFEDYLVNLRFINNCSTDVTIQDIAISFHDTITGNCVQKCYRNYGGYDLSLGESNLIGEQACNVNPETDPDPCSNDPLVPGEYLLVYKLKINGEWKEVAEKSVEVLGSSIGDSFEPDNSSISANTINTSFSQNHSIIPEDDEDWLKFTLNSPSNIIIETTGESGDTELWLYDDSLTQITYDDNGGTDNFSKISRDGLAAGIYFIKVNEYGNNDTISLYNVRLTVELPLNSSSFSWNLFLPAIISKTPADNSNNGPYMRIHWFLDGQSKKVIPENFEGEIVQLDSWWGNHGLKIDINNTGVFDYTNDDTGYRACLDNLDTCVDAHERSFVFTNGFSFRDREKSKTQPLSI